MIAFSNPASITDLHGQEQDSLKREDEERFKAIADSCPSMMWETDADGTFQFLNKACRLFGGTDQEKLDAGAWQSLFIRTM